MGSDRITEAAKARMKGASNRCNNAKQIKVINVACQSFLLPLPRRTIVHANHGAMPLCEILWTAATASSHLSDTPGRALGIAAEVNMLQQEPVGLQ